MMKRKQVLVCLLALVFLSGCERHLNILPRPVYQLNWDGKPAGNVCWIMPGDWYVTNMEYKDWKNVLGDRCQGWIRK